MTIVSILTYLLQPIFIYLTCLFLTKFVFLENGINKKYSPYFHAVVILILEVVSFINDYASSSIFMIAIAIYIFLGHSGKFIKRFLSALLVIPIIGLYYGLTSVPGAIASVSTDTEESRELFLFIFFFSVIIVIAALYYYRKEQIVSLIKDTEDRTLKSWERLLLCFIGIIQTLDFSTYLENSLDQEVTLVFYSLTQFILTLTVIILVLVGNKQNYYHNKVTSMQFNIIVMMAEIVENRDKNTGGHIKRTAKYVEIIAKQLKKNGKFTNILTDSYIKNMCVAAPLHDIGKIHVSDTILNHDGPLSDADFATMKTHAPEGRALLKNAKTHLGEFEYLNIAVEMAGYHHEWWDGSSKGYPDQIKGEDIPLSARIMAVADVFDALTSKRVYKPAMPIEKAYSIIESEKGTHFDPDVIDAFFDASKEIEFALNMFREEHSDEDDYVAETTNNN